MPNFKKLAQSILNKNDTDVFEGNLKMHCLRSRPSPAQRHNVQQGRKQIDGSYLSHTHDCGSVDKPWIRLPDYQQEGAETFLSELSFKRLIELISVACFVKEQIKSNSFCNLPRFYRWDDLERSVELKLNVCFHK